MDRQGRRTQRETDEGGETAERTFPASPECLSEIRRFVRSVGGTGAVDLELVASELATNAVQHGDGPVTVRVTRVGDLVRVAVHDSGGGRPVASDVPADAERGRGLKIVASVATGWGVERDDAGKWVWAELRAAAELDGHERVDVEGLSTDR